MLKNHLLSQILDGTLTDYKRHLSGICKDYYICIDFKEPYYAVRINACLADGKMAQDLAEFLAGLKSDKHHMKTIELTEHEITLIVAQPNFKKHVPEILNGIIEPILEYLFVNGYRSGCAKCGEEGDVCCVEIEKQQHHLFCKDCAAEVTAEKQKKRNR